MLLTIYNTTTTPSRNNNLFKSIVPVLVAIALSPSNIVVVAIPISNGAIIENTVENNAQINVMNSFSL